MRIALVVHKFPPASLGGTEVYTQNLARELSRQGHDVFVFYRHNHPGPGESEITREDKEGFRAYRVSRSPDSGSLLEQFLNTFFSPEIEQAYRQFLDEAEPHIVHFQHVMSLSYRLIALTRQRELPSMLTLHDYWFICANSQLIWPDGQTCRGKALGINCARCVLTARLNSPLMPLLRPVAAPLVQVRDFMVRRAALAADLLVAPSHFLIEQYTKAGFPADRFIQLENGIDVERIRRFARRASPDGKLRFTYLGSLAWQKGVHILVKAFQAISADEAVLRVYGDPTAFPDYSAHLKKIANPDNTFFEGTVPNEEVGRVLARTDVVVVPSVWYENSPVVIQEAFAAGVPVIGSQIGALAEKIRHDINGLLCMPSDVGALREAICSFIRRSEQLQLFRMHIPPAKAIEEHVDKMQRVYRSLTG